MLTKAEISNYRGFKSYKMDGLARVNLLVGKNNSGKTALLEALQFLTSGGEMYVLAQAAQRRGEVIITRGDRFPTRFEITHFFHGHVLSVEEPFGVKGDNGFPPVSVRVVAVDEGKEKKPTRAGGQLPSFGVKIEGGRSSDHAHRLYRLTRDGGVVVEDGPYFYGVDPATDQPILIRRTEQSSVRFISSDSLDSGALGQMWDEIVVAKKESEIANALKILEPDVESVQMLTGMLPYAQVGSRAGVVVGLASQKSRFPLGSMGEGMRRMLALSTSLACTKHGSLFIDEIDTGLHYSVMMDMWKLIIKKAVDDEVQVFATTHSWDCIEGLSLLCQREKELMGSVSVHKIDRAIPKSVHFGGDAVAGMSKMDFDPRQ